MCLDRMYVHTYNDGCPVLHPFWHTPSSRRRECCGYCTTLGGGEVKDGHARKRPKIAGRSVTLISDKGVVVPGSPVGGNKASPGGWEKCLAVVEMGTSEALSAGPTVYTYDTTCEWCPGLHQDTSPSVYVPFARDSGILLSGPRRRCPPNPPPRLHWRCGYRASSPLQLVL